MDIIELQAAFDAKSPLEQAQDCEQFALLLSHIQERSMRSAIIRSKAMDALIAELMDEAKQHRAKVG